jgi:hypothetical protein
VAGLPAGGTRRFDKIQPLAEAPAALPGDHLKSSEQDALIAWGEYHWELKVIGDGMRRVEQIAALKDQAAQTAAE